MPSEQRRKTRGPEIAMVFQDALSSLNPVFPVGGRSRRCSACTAAMNKSDALERAVKLMQRVQIPAAKERVRRLPAPVLRRHAPTHR